MTSTKMLSCLTPLTVLVILLLRHLEAAQMKEVKLGERVELKCNLSLYNEVHWLKISEGEPVPLMVTSLKYNGELAVVWNYDKTQFEGFMDNQMTGMSILNVSNRDLVTYYCATLYQKRMDFDKGVQLYTNQLLIKRPFDQVQGAEGFSMHYQIFAAILCFGLVGLLLAVSVVHMKTSKRRDYIEE